MAYNLGTTKVFNGPKNDKGKIYTYFTTCDINEAYNVTIKQNFPQNLNTKKTLLDEMVFERICESRKIYGLSMRSNKEHPSPTICMKPFNC